MKSLEEYRKPEFVAHCKASIKDFLSETQGIRNVLISTLDGFEIASHIARSDHSSDNLAAVGSSMFAMGASLVEQLGLSDCNSITIDSKLGKIYIRTISKGDGNSVVLLLQTTKNAMLASILYHSDKLAKNILDCL